MGGDPTCVPPNFNDFMKAIWEELWESMPQSGKVSITVNKLLQQYKERCRTERKRKLDDESPLALLPVSFAQAKDWLMKQQRAQSEAVEAGAVNEEAREIISDLSHLLEERPPSVLHLLEQPPLSASPIILPPQLSMGPETVTEAMKSEERRKQKAKAIQPVTEAKLATQKQPTTTQSTTAQTPKPKKPKTVPPEMEERQQRAAARMLQLGVSPIKVHNRISFLCSLYMYNIA